VVACEASCDARGHVAGVVRTERCVLRRADACFRAVEHAPHRAQMIGDVITRHARGRVQPGDFTQPAVQGFLECAVAQPCAVRLFADDAPACPVIPRRVAACDGTFALTQVILHLKVIQLLLEYPFFS